MADGIEAEFEIQKPEQSMPNRFANRRPFKFCQAQHKIVILHPTTMTMSKNKKSLNSKHQSSTKGAEPSRPVDATKPISSDEGGLATSSNALPATSTAKEHASLKQSGSGGKIPDAAAITTIDCNTGASSPMLIGSLLGTDFCISDIVPTNYSSDALAAVPLNEKPISLAQKEINPREARQSTLQEDIHHVQDGVQVVPPSLLLDGPPPLTSPKDGSGLCVDDGQALKDDLARALLELEEARHEIAAKTSHEKAMSDQIEEHVAKIEHLTKENESTADQLRELRLEFNDHIAGAMEARADLREDVLYLRSKNRQLVEEKRDAQERLEKLGVQVNDMLEKFNTMVEQHCKWNESCIAELKGQLLSSNSSLALALQQEQNYLHLVETYRFNNERLTEKNNEIQSKFNRLEFEFMKESDSNLIKQKAMLDQINAHREEIEKLRNEKEVLEDKFEYRLVGDLLRQLIASIKLATFDMACKDSPTEDDFTEWANSITRETERLNRLLTYPDLVNKCPWCFEGITLADWQDFSRREMEMVRTVGLPNLKDKIIFLGSQRLRASTSNPPDLVTKYLSHGRRV